MVTQTPIDWSNLTEEQACVLETLMSKAAQTLIRDIDGCKQRMKASAPDSNWHMDAKSELAQWERLAWRTQAIRSVAMRIRMRRHRALAA